MTRVAHILGNLEYGGLQRIVLALIRELPAYSHAVYFNSTTRGPLYEEYSAACEIHQCPYPRGSFVGALKYMPRLARELREFAPDVVIAHLFGNHLVVGISARLAGVPATYGVSANDPVHYSRSRWKPMLLAQLARPFCRGEIAVSEAVANVLRDALRLPARRAHVVENGCPVEPIAARADAGRAAAVRTDGRYRLLMVAFLGRAKDHETAIRSVAELRKNGHDVVLSFAGQVRRQEVQKRFEELARQLGVSDSVKFLGGRDDIPELMGASHVVIHATHSEGLPGAILEAFASRTPVVATDIPSCHEVLDGGRCGLLVPPRDPIAMARAVESILTQDDLRRRVVKAAFERVNARYHTRRMAAGYATLIDGSVRR